MRLILKGDGDTGEPRRDEHYGGEHHTPLADGWCSQPSEYVGDPSPTENTLEGKDRALGGAGGIPPQT